jgi:hypothetical protein
MRRGISEIIGESVNGRGESQPVYRALRTLLCSGCGSPIPSGSLFTRRALPDFGPRIMPRCGKCAPFEMNRKEQTEGQADAPAAEHAGTLTAAETLPTEVADAKTGEIVEGSRLIEKLLTPDLDSPPGVSGAGTTRELSEGAASRLAPALSRSRNKSE